MTTYEEKGGAQEAAFAPSGRLVVVGTYRGEVLCLENALATPVVTSGPFLGTTACAIVQPKHWGG